MIDLVAIQVFNLPTNQFSALSIAPRTPVRRGHTLDSLSSLESTPESTEVPLDGLRLGFADLDSDAEFLPALPNTSFSLHASAFPRFASLKDDMMWSGYADFSVSPQSSRPDLFN
jgi:hypothetical protein